MADVFHHIYNGSICYTGDVFLLNFPQNILKTFIAKTTFGPKFLVVVLINKSQKYVETDMSTDNRKNASNFIVQAN